MNRSQNFLERACIHRPHSAEGEFYQGVAYVRALEGLRASRAVEAARQIGPFFWSDAPHVRVWLCRGCADALALAAGGN